MVSFDVKDMSCGHCVATITKAVQGIDPGARVTADLAVRRVEVESTAAADRIRGAIEDAGYDAVLRGSAC